MSKLPLLNKSFPPPSAWETGRGKTEVQRSCRSTHQHEDGFVALEDPLGYLLLLSHGQTKLLLLHYRLKHQKMEPPASKFSVFLVGFFSLVLEQVLTSGYRCLAENLRSLQNSMPLRKYLCGEGLHLWESTLGYPYQCTVAFPPREQVPLAV